MSQKFPATDLNPNRLDVLRLHQHLYLNAGEDPPAALLATISRSRSVVGVFTDKLPATSIYFRSLLTAFARIWAL